MPMNPYSPLQHVIYAGFDLLKQVLNLLWGIENGFSKCPWIFFSATHYLWCKLVPFSSALLRSQCFCAVTAASCFHCCFSLLENSFQAAFQHCLPKDNDLGSLFGLVLVLSSYFQQMVIWTGQKWENITRTICGPWGSNDTLPQSPGVHPVPNEPWWFLLLS